MGRNIAVIGGGAAGMTAAIHAAACGARVTVYERNDRVGKKILSTGNGRCNFSNERMSADCYRGGGAGLVDAVYARFGVRETKEFFQRLGMRIRDRDGYLYPASGQAATVLDVLRYELERLSVEVRTCAQVQEIAEEPDGIAVSAGGPARESYDAVILACGGQAAPATGSDGQGFVLAQMLGHHIIPTAPALAALRCGEDFCRRAAGVRCEARVALYIDGQAVCADTGELQWTDYGISGIPVFQISREAAYALLERRSVTVRIDLVPDLGGGAAERAFWEKRWESKAGQTAEQFVTGLVNKKLALLLLRLADIGAAERAAAVSLSRRRRLEKLFRGLTVTVRGVNSFEQAQVCAGGVDCAEITESLESRLVPHVYFAGEILDIDGLCGGYNLQWAWSSGAVAGRAAAGQGE